MNKRQVVLESISALLIMLFLYASVSKILDFDRFIGETNNQPLPNSWTPFIVWTVPSLEIAISLALIFERTRLAGFIASTALMTIFTVYAAIVLLHLLEYVTCSCGGIIRKLTWQQHLEFNIFFTALSVMGIILQRRSSFKSIFITKNSFV